MWASLCTPHLFILIIFKLKYLSLNFLCIFKFRFHILWRKKNNLLSTLLLKGLIQINSPPEWLWNNPKWKKKTWIKCSSRPGVSKCIYMFPIYQHNVYGRENERRKQCHRGLFLFFTSEVWMSCGASCGRAAHRDSVMWSSGYQDKVGPGNIWLLRFILVPLTAGQKCISALTDNNTGVIKRSTTTIQLWALCFQSLT